ncbi:hypothetical protein N7501_010364 [Penicillium viridicatum]|nr:hypothetical protein N7501_010364 [Penicillium viridicatum]
MGSAPGDLGRAPGTPPEDGRPLQSSIFRRRSTRPTGTGGICPVWDVWRPAVDVETYVPELVKEYDDEQREKHN